MVTCDQLFFHPPQQLPLHDSHHSTKEKQNPLASGAVINCPSAGDIGIIFYCLSNLISGYIFKLTAKSISSSSDDSYASGPPLLYNCLISSPVKEHLEKWKIPITQRIILLSVIKMSHIALLV